MKKNVAQRRHSVLNFTAWKVSKYRVNSGPYFPAFGLNTERYGVLSPNVGKYRPEKTPYLDTFHAVGIGTIYGLMVEIRGKIHLKFT